MTAPRIVNRLPAAPPTFHGTHDDNVADLHASAAAVLRVLPFVNPTLPSLPSPPLPLTSYLTHVHERVQFCLCSFPDVTGWGTRFG